jgi:homoserine dehydrogenase
VGVPLRIRRIADLDVTRDRGVSVPEGVLTTDGFQVARDPEVQIVIELVGGTGAAKDFLLEAIRNGKSVVTANKSLLAEHGPEISRAAQAAGVDMGFEASVGGGIPNEGKEYPGVLAEAQKIGLAEADPSFDVDGIDSAHKLAILVWLATGMFVSPKEIFVEGIRDVSALDIAFAREFGYVIKLLAIAKEKGDGVEVRVHPTMIPSDHLLATVGGANNAIYVKGDFIGSALFYGQGAGMYPTASAVVSDVIEIARNLRGGGVGRIPPSGFFLHDPGERAAVSPFTDVRSEYYLRFQVVDKPGVLSKIAGALGSHSISISSVIQKGRKEESAVPIVIVTHHARESDMRAALTETDRLPVVLDRTRMIRIENNL